MSSRSTALIRDFVTAGIAAGDLASGQKLPTERQMAQRFALSRAAVREALTVLEAERLIIRHVGRGTFVAETCTGHMRGADGSLRDQRALLCDTSPAKILEARNVLEAQLAELAVINATESDLRLIAECCELLREAGSAVEFEDGDAAFHRAIAEATHNDLLLAAYDTISAARLGSEWRGLKERRHRHNPARRQAVVEEHRAIVAALRDRNAGAAREAMLCHLAKVRANLIGY